MNTLKFILECSILVILVRLCVFLWDWHKAKKFFTMALKSEYCYQIFNEAKNNDTIHIKISENEIKGLLEYVEETIEYYDKKHLNDYQNQIAMDIYENLIKMATELRRWIWTIKE